MANSPKGAGNILGPIAIVTAVVVIALIATFSLSGESPPDEQTIIPEEVNGEPAGAGTTPEGEADETEEGVTDVIDEVDPAAPGEESVPPADQSPEQSPDGDVEGETNADETTAGTADEPVTDQPAQEADNATGGEPQNTTTSSEAGTGGADGQLDEGDGTTQQSDDESQGAQGDDVDYPSSGDAEGFPDGRDADTELTPSEDQDVVRDEDQGGTGFVPTPSGPEGRDNETIAE